MSTYNIVPNQPLGWSETIPTDGCGCEQHEYCAPLLFEINNYVYEAYTARAVADGALASDIPEACMEEIMDTFYELSRAIRYVSENISFLYEKTAEQEPCNNLDVILEDTGLVVLTDETTLLRDGDPGYVEGAVGFNTQGGGPEPIPQSMDFTAYDFIAQDCVNTFSFTITPDNDLEFPWTILITNEYGDVYEIESGVDPAAAFSVTFDMIIGPNGFTIDVPADAEAIFDGIISLRAMFVSCSFEALGLVTSETSEVIGEIVESEVSFETVDGIQLGFFNGKIGVAEITLEIKCAYIKFGSECCCTDFFYSKCIKPITDPCHTVKIEYWQTPTRDGSFGFGFYYPDATVGNEFKQFMRVWGEVRNPQYDGESTMYEDSFGRKNLIYIESREFKSFIINYSPEYVHNALRLACRHDNFELTDVSYNIIAQNSFTRSETYSPSWIRISRLAPVTLEVEKKTQNLIGGTSKTFCS